MALFLFLLDTTGLESEALYSNPTSLITSFVNKDKQLNLPWPYVKWRVRMYLTMSKCELGSISIQNA
jgi:hypothetical protein